MSAGLNKVLLLFSIPSMLFLQLLKYKKLTCEVGIK